MCLVRLGSARNDGQSDGHLNPSMVGGWKTEGTRESLVNIERTQECIIQIVYHIARRESPRLHHE